MRRLPALTPVALVVLSSGYYFRLGAVPTLYFMALTILLTIVSNVRIRRRII